MSRINFISSNEHEKKFYYLEPLAVQINKFYGNRKQVKKKKYIYIKILVGLLLTFYGPAIHAVQVSGIEDKIVFW